jgi:sugar/nucleoside kinase (ribokinase family)
MLAQPVLADEILDAVADVSRQYVTTFVLTRGANSILLAQGGDVRVVPVTSLSPTEVFNPIGSGDAFLAGMVARLVAAAPASDRRFTMAALAGRLRFRHGLRAIERAHGATGIPRGVVFALDYRA